MRQSIFNKDIENHRMMITREFNAPIDHVWRAWTDPSIIDLWWAPKPWKAETKSHNFTVGGEWLYCMNGPEGEKHWAKATFHKVEAPILYEGLDAFCDEEGIVNPEIPSMYWKVQFEDKGDSTVVNIEITFDSVESLETIVSMGFQEGFTMAHGNLDELIEKNAI
jgi:uncharacterized protein YndB with AHSA1/START domain